MIRRKIAICTAVEDRSPLNRVLPLWREIDFTINGQRTDVVCVAAVNDAGPETRRALARGLAPIPVLSVEVHDLAALVPNLDWATRPWNNGIELVISHKRAALRAAVNRMAVAQEADWLLWLDSDNTIPPAGFQCLLETLTATTGPLAPRVVSGIYAERREGELLARRWGGHHKDHVPPIQIAPNSTVAAGYMGFGATLVPYDTAANPHLDFLTRFSVWRDHRRTQRELCEGRAFEVWGEDPLWYLACETYYGVPLYVDTRVCARHWRDEWSYWEPVASAAGWLDSQLVWLDADGQPAQTIPRGGELPPLGQPAPTAEVSLQEAAG